jgi:hypothetical protein
MARFFSAEQLAQPGGFGRFARGMTYVAVTVFFMVAVVMALLTISWVVTGPIELASYKQAPQCAAAFTDSCRGFVTGQITRASIAGGQTDFDVTAGRHSYTHNLTENTAPDLTVGEALLVEVWRGSVAAVTLPDGERVITGSDPEWQAANYVLPVVGVLMFPFLSFLGFQQLRAARRGARAARQAAAQHAALPADISEFADSLVAEPPQTLRGGDIVVTPSVQPGTVFRPRNLWIAAFGVLVLATPIGFAIAAGRIPTTPRASGTFFGSLMMLPLLVLFILGLIGYRQLFLRNVRLELLTGTLRVRDWAGREQSWPRSSIRGLALVSVRPAGSSRGESRLVILGTSGSAVANLNGAFFDPRELATLGERLGSPVFADVDGPVDAVLLNKRFPGAATWLELHPGPVTVAFVVILLLAGLIAWGATQLIAG